MLSVPRARSAMVLGQCPARPFWARSSDPPPLGGAMAARVGNDWGRGRVDVLALQHNTGFGIGTPGPGYVIRHRGPAQALHLHVGADLLEAEAQACRTTLSSSRDHRPLKPEDRPGAQARGWGAHSEAPPSRAKTNQRTLEIDPASLPVTARTIGAQPPRGRPPVIVWLSSLDQHPASVAAVDGIDRAPEAFGDQGPGRLR